MRHLNVYSLCYTSETNKRLYVNATERYFFKNDIVKKKKHWHTILTEKNIWDVHCVKFSGPEDLGYPLQSNIYWDAWLVNTIYVTSQETKGLIQLSGS